jgi:hypothetical protein
MVRLNPNADVNREMDIDPLFGELMDGRSNNTGR